MQKAIIAIIAGITEEDTSEYAGEDSIPDILPDSTARLELLAKISEKYGVKVKSKQLYQGIKTIDELAEYVEAQRITTTKN